LKRVQPLAPKEQDVFPKHFRCNTVPKLRRAMKRHGFDAVVYGFDSDPQYLEFSKAAYFLGVLHQKYAPRLFAPAIFAFGRKNG
jgi:Xaa-Pro aminopeptidase